ncbi:Rhs family protein [Burkholderia lata]|uniref:RHS repeat domain-containing protein n=1 Tax=Burkholderia lata (strain ATCC 17760 / DSM 23089 / LMG 22485 / NCIMB 9086 / R18194 / 383) TaxID=482957 RepID=UPI001452F22E|nr:RHS repeat-associated core domain-containing protein [Burkholderia lata]VWC43298.1 Rhs family protein [Burkholderia lata]
MPQLATSSQPSLRIQRALRWSQRARRRPAGSRSLPAGQRLIPIVLVAQAVRDDAIELLDQPEYGDYYRKDEDPLWLPPPPAPAIDSLAWYQCDHLGTPQELTDEHSEIAWSAEYRAWGVAQEVTRKISVGRVELRNPLRFQGQYHDQETGLHYNRYRYYDPNSGRYIIQDPLGLQAMGPALPGMGNLYRADIFPPLPTIARHSIVGSALGDISNFPWPLQQVPGEWVGVNMVWTMSESYCAAGYYGGDPLEDLRPTDNSGSSCKAKPQNDGQYFYVKLKDGRKLTCKR